jgi:tRNA-Thr(GGU) m(6)t(6)A37 methyltransferase TsaA
MSGPALTVVPIGVIRTPYTDRYRAPRQPGADGQGGEGLIVLEPNCNYEQALEDLEGFDRIWVIYWFHRNTTWRPKILPPRGARRKRGLFATRSPHRPNPLGLSLLRLIEVRGRTIRVADVDLLDGTPVLDIKPYLPYVESFPDSRMGWLEEAIAGEEKRYEVLWAPAAEERAAWLLDAHRIQLAPLATTVLARDPWPHPYRRISPHPSGMFELALKSWRMLFRIEGERVVIEEIRSGYQSTALADPGELHDRAAHEEFHRRYPATE